MLFLFIKEIVCRHGFQAQASRVQDKLTIDKINIRVLYL